MALTERQQIDLARQRRPGKVRISMTQGDDRDEVRVQLQDQTSGAILAVIEFDARDYGIALRGAEVPCDFRITGQTVVGKKRETKTMTIFVPDGLKASKEHAWGPDPDDPMLRRTLAPFEVSGWTARQSDILNRHNRREVGGNALIQLALAADLEDVEGHAQDVTFVRYVDPDTGEPVKLDGGR